MPTIKANDVLDRVNQQLVDVGYIRWTRDELVNYLNDAMRAVVTRRPDACVTDDVAFACAAGTRQTLPADAIRLSDVVSNQAGRAIRGPFDKRTLDAQYPYWYGDSDAAEAELYLYDQRNPKTFYLYPGVQAGTVINLVYFANPPTLTLAQVDADTTISIDDVYSTPLVDWMLYRCYAKDADFAANGNKAVMHLEAFKAALGEKSQADAATASAPIKE